MSSAGILVLPSGFIAIIFFPQDERDASLNTTAAINLE
jgi:hypothetical protein